MKIYLSFRSMLWTSLLIVWYISLVGNGSNRFSCFISRYPAIRRHTCTCRIVCGITSILCIDANWSPQWLSAGANQVLFLLPLLHKVACWTHTFHRSVVCNALSRNIANVCGPWCIIHMTPASLPQALMTAQVCSSGCLLPPSSLCPSFLCFPFLPPQLSSLLIPFSFVSPLFFPLIHQDYTCC